MYIFLYVLYFAESGWNCFIWKYGILDSLELKKNWTSTYLDDFLSVILFFFNLNLFIWTECYAKMAGKNVWHVRGLSHLKIKFLEPLFGSQPNNSVAHRTTRKLQLSRS